MRRPIIRRPVPNHAGSHLKGSFHEFIVGNRKKSLMRKSLLGTLAMLAVSLARAQAPLQLPRGTATDVTNDEIQATLKKTATAAVSDQAIRVISINREYNVGVGVVHRARTNGTATPNGIEHSQITEIYHVIEGTATLVTGGTIENPRDSPPEGTIVKVLNGPSTGGGVIANGTSRKIGPGDVVIIPPNTPHWFSEISSDQIVYLVVRVDPNKVLPAGYGAK